MAENSARKCGNVAILGRPNVGKSTLLNHILKQKVSITCRKPQTTRHQILGIKTEGDVQAVYVDTPGIHRNQKNAMNRYMNRAASSIIHDVDVILFVVEEYWHSEDNWIVQQLQKATCPIVLVINKVDKVKEKEALLPLIAEVSKHLQFSEVVPISAKKGSNLDNLEKVVAKYLPYNDFFYQEDQLTDRSDKFLTAEIIREKLMRNLGQELPYSLTVEIVLFEETPTLLTVSANIFVERDSQKAIVIGYKGEKLRDVGQDARIELEKMFGRKVFLQLWVKVRAGWSDDERALRSLGYE